MKKHKIISVILLSMLLGGCGRTAANREMIQTDEVVLQDGEVSASDHPLDTGSETVDAEVASDMVLEEIAAGQAALSGVYNSIELAADSSGSGSNGFAPVEMGFGDPATMNQEVDGRELPIYCVDTQDNKVALSFDAAWGAEDTEEILAILQEHDIHVTFFATGGWVESYPEDVKAVLAAGHDLGNHSENHLNMSELSNGEKKEELMSVHEKVKELTGYEMFLFRPPYGDYDNDVINVARNCGYYTIQWDVDSLDWMNKGVDSIIETVTKHKNLGNGSIILCHNGAEYTVQALEDLITGLEEQGYEIVPVSELIYRENFHLNYEGRQIAD